MYCLKMISTTTFPRVDKDQETMNTSQWAISIENIFNKFFIIHATGDGSCFFRAFYKGFHNATSNTTNIQEDKFVKLYRLQSAVYNLFQTSHQELDKDLKDDINFLSIDDNDQDTTLTEIITERLNNKELIRRNILFDHGKFAENTDKILKEKTDALVDKLCDDAYPQKQIVNDILSVLHDFENTTCWAELYDIQSMYLIHNALCITYNPQTKQIYQLHLIENVNDTTKIILLENVNQQHFNLYAIQSTLHPDIIVAHVQKSELRDMQKEYRYYNYIYKEFCKSRPQCNLGAGAFKQLSLRWKNKKTKKNKNKLRSKRHYKRVAEIIKRKHVMYP